MKKTLILAATALMIISCGKKETTTEGVETTAPAIEETTIDVATDTQENVLEIEGNDQMQFNKTELRAKAGEPITLTLKHVGQSGKDIMGHNFVLLKPGTDIAQFGNDAVNAKDSDYIPAEHANDVIAHTKLIGGGESDTITIDALEPGTYDYICSFPGHYAIMKGQLIVE
ncbi:azurin [Weeksellaceae bacterium TAE3-ERU29]|nr:azurin [Weeksellaceae bacterium TAE3-ERU29]